MSNKQIFKVYVQKDGQLRVEEQRISIEYEQIKYVLTNLAEELIKQGHTGTISISAIVFFEDDKQKELEMSDFTIGYGERKIK